MYDYEERRIRVSVAVYSEIMRHQYGVTVARLVEVVSPQPVYSADEVGEALLVMLAQGHITVSSERVVTLAAPIGEGKQP